MSLYLLCAKENFTITSGDLNVLLCAVVYSIYILLVAVVLAQRPEPNRKDTFSETKSE